MRLIHLDLPSMLAMFILANLTTTLILASVARAHASDGLREWAFATGMHTLAYISVAIREDSIMFASIVLSNGFFAAAFAMETEGLLQFQKRPLKRWIVWFPVVLTLVQSAILSKNAYDRLTLNSLVFSVQAALFFVLLMQRRRVTVGTGQYFIGLGMLLAFSTTIYRAASNVMNEWIGTAYPNDLSLTILLSTPTMLFVSLGFILMTKERADHINYQLSVHDDLTGLFNRRFLDDTLEREVKRAQRSAQPLTVVLIDVDHFKKYNDTYGHQAGDNCLIKVAQVLALSARRPGDVAARYGGEEFVLVLTDTDQTAAAQVAELARSALEALAIPHSGSASGHVTISLGIATSSVEFPAEVDDLLRRADQMLYRAKDAGRNQVCS